MPKGLWGRLCETRGGHEAQHVHTVGAPSCTSYPGLEGVGSSGWQTGPGAWQRWD